MSATSATVAHPKKQPRATASLLLANTPKIDRAQRRNNAVAIARNNRATVGRCCLCCRAAQQAQQPPIETQKAVAPSRARLHAPSKRTAARLRYRLRLRYAGRSA
jgi:hypothetical protein